MNVDYFIIRSICTVWMFHENDTILSNVRALYVQLISECYMMNEYPGDIRRLLMKRARIFRATILSNNAGANKLQPNDMCTRFLQTISIMHKFVKSRLIVINLSFWSTLFYHLSWWKKLQALKTEWSEKQSAVRFHFASPVTGIVFLLLSIAHDAFTCYAHNA